jgi:hypothetical protein
MKVVRKILNIQASKEVTEGAGVRLKRVLGRSDGLVGSNFILKI